VRYLARCDYGGDNITAMATDDDRDYVLAALSPLCEPLHDGFAVAAQRVARHFDRYDMSLENYSPFWSHLMRGHVINFLAGSELADWRVGRRRPNGQALLTRQAMSLRLLRPNHDGAIPAPGSNSARISYYRNPKLSLFGPAASNLIGIWDIDFKTGLPEIRIVRTTGQWKNGQANEIDLDFILPTDSDTIFGLEFVPTDEGLALPFDFDEEEGNAGSFGG
jgi:hypothetical protein